LALALAEAGADVAIADLLSERDQTASEIKTLGRKSIAIEADITLPEQVNSLAQKVRDTFGKIDILVNNAGINIISPCEEFGLKDWHKVLNVNLTGMWLCTQAVGKIMIQKRKGKIINIASVYGHVGSSTHPAIAYGSSKAGVIGFTRTLAVEWAKYGINVNAISPGFTITELTRQRLEDKAYYEKVVSRIPLGRLGVPEDLSGAVIFLASAASDFITGHILPVDGGWLAT
jgi:2-deoxy-D-gluconate 3-dehydrogenase